MRVGRRDALALLGFTAAAASFPVGAITRNFPPVWLIERNRAQVFIFPIGDAKDRSWLTPKLQVIFDGSNEVWFESPHPDPAVKTTISDSISSSSDADDAQHSLFDTLGPRRSSRLLTAAQTYGVSRDALEHKRPWAAYFVLNAGFWAHRTQLSLGTMQDSPDYVLAQMARDTGKPIRSEYPTKEAVRQLYSGMPTEVQCERLEYLLDYFDDEEAGKHSDPYGWIHGHTSTLTIDEMRLRYPALYQIEHVERNIKWATWINGFLDHGGVYLIGMGMNHTLGPDSILAKLKLRGLMARAV